MNLSVELCEFIGAVIGDGFLGPSGHTYQLQIAGDTNLDEDYHTGRLVPIAEKLFSVKPSVVVREKYGRHIRIHSKQLYMLLTKRFGIPSGKKCYTVSIPDEILLADSVLVNATIRGIFDTDGGVGLDRRTTYRKPYIRLNHVSASKILSSQVSAILRERKIPHSVHERTYVAKQWQIQINGFANVQRFIDTIGFSNPRHICKLASVGIINQKPEIIKSSSII